MEETLNTDLQQVQSLPKVKRYASGRSEVSSSDSADRAAYSGSH
jgi:hypothetical protein